MDRIAPQRRWLSAVVVGYLRYPLSNPISTALTVIGAAGLSDDVATWQGWIEGVVSGPAAAALAERAAALGAWVGQPVSRITFLVVGIASMFWGLPQFWRFRHKLIFKWRRKLAESVWIEQSEAKAILKNSTWGQLKKPVQSVFANISLGFAEGMTEAEKTRRKFSVYLDLTLRSFRENNPDSCREVEGNFQYEEGAIRRFAEAAMREEVVDQFGPIPDANV